MDYKVLSFETDIHWDKKECLEELADYLSDTGFIISDIEKTWVEEESYGCKKYRLQVLILGYYKEC